MKPFERKRVVAILKNTIGQDPTSWSTIVAAVKAEIDIKNWLEVRCMMQGLINAKQIARTDSTEKEEYFDITKKAAPTLAELRAAAYAAFADHENDMATNPEYRAVAEAQEARATAKAKKAGKRL